MFESAPFDDEKTEECARLVRVCAEIFSGPNLSEHGMAVYLNAIRCSDADKQFPGPGKHPPAHPPYL